MQGLRGCLEQLPPNTNKEENRARRIVRRFALAVNLEILWVKKFSQFQERARPSELLKQAAAASDGSVTVNCFPLADFVAQAVLDSVGTRAAFEHSATPQDANCFSVQYTQSPGQVIHESRRLGTERHGTFY